MDEHKKYLADRILSEERPITYRLLSRALDVHVNTAKEMLHDYHKYQNELRANSVHATYLVYGTKTIKAAREDGDVDMSSSMPDIEANPEDAPASTLTVVAQETLEDILAEYQLVTSVHVYSLAPHPQRDLTLLSEATRSLSEYTNKEDAVTAAKKYGIIVNPQLRCRKRPAQLKAPPPPASKPNVKQETTTAKPAQMTKVKQEVADAPSKNSTPTSSASKPTAPTLKRGSSGGIMQSFAKASALPPRVKSTVKKHKEDAHAALSDDGEADDSDIPPTKKVLVDANAVRNSRQQREDELRRMMEEDDDGDDDNDEEAQDNEDDPADEEMEDGPEQEPEPDSVSGSKEDKEAVEMVSSTRDGRRRGKRRVMKKKRIVDDQGYMVTIQEAGWESFSEDETPAVSAKKETSTPTSSSGNAKAKKPAAKGAQGNIMSFFAKK